MSANVIAFNDSVPPGEAHQELIETLEGLLVRARSGDLRAIAYVTVGLSGNIGTGWDGANGTRYKIASGVMMLHHRYASSMLGDE